ncbi:MAG: hypothetical protein H7210_04530, partial [Pyrinomonadaceae bacterium]|nr:hypothetical protein [Phycisphaerales bacterium]
MHSTAMTRRLILGSCVALLSSSATAQTGTAHFTRIDADGMHVETILGQTARVQGSGLDPRGSGIVWHVSDPVSIVYSICAGDRTDETWLGNNLNFERLTSIATSGDGAPIFEFNDKTNSDVIAVASAENASLAVMLRGFANPPMPAAVRGFTRAGGSTPLWTFSFEPEFVLADFHGVDVSGDGALVAAVARDGVKNKSHVVLLDGATGVEIRRLQFDSLVPAVELSDDGSRLVVTDAATARVYRTSDLTELVSFGVGGQGGFARISRDGTTVAAGGFNYMAWREVGGAWTQILNRSDPNSWFGSALALSGNGDTLFAPSYNFATGYLELTYRVVDLVGEGAPEVARATTTGTGGYQDTLQGA